jgi:hypothetical protein
MWIPTLILALAAQASLIEGEVRDARSHKVIPSAKVTLVSARTTTEWQYTDRNGRFRFTALPDARYILSVEHPAYKSVELDGSALFAAQPARMLVELNEIEKPPETGSVVSVSELQLPSSVRREFERARTYLTQNQYKDAEAVLLEVLRKHPEADIADVHLLLAKVYLHNQDLDAVVEQLEIYLRLAPDGPTADGIRRDLEKYRSKR